MTSIELTEAHKSKLLEMCNKLFPETNWHFWESELDYYPDGMLGYNMYSVLGVHEKTQASLEIHWFEFCMTHLAEKIIVKFTINKNGDKIYKRTLNDDLSKFYLNSLNFSRGFNKKHPIDYLYKQFILIKF